MNKKIFFPKERKSGPFWKTLSFLLLSAGASSVTNLESIVIGEKITINTFLEKPKFFDYSDVRIILDTAGRAEYVFFGPEKIKIKEIKGGQELADLLISKNPKLKDSPSA